MNIRDLDQRITFQVVNQSRDAVGGVVESWADLYQVWAMRRDLKGKEAVEALQKVATAEVLFTIRASSQTRLLTAKNRLIHRGQVFEIVAPPVAIPSGRPVKIELLTRALDG